MLDIGTLPKVKLIRSNVLKILYSVMSVALIFRTYYATSRPLFPSGPDSPTYIPAMLDFAKNGLMSSEITGMPYFPSGYPLIFSIFPRFAPMNWVLLSQLLQIAMSIASIYLLFRIVIIFFDDEFIALMSALCFALLPAYSVMAGEAMYETFMVFLLLSLIFILGRFKSVTWAALLAGVIAGVAIAVHPRVLPFVALVLIWLFWQKRIKDGLVVTLAFSILDAILLLRNAHIYKTFTLYGAGQVNYNIGHVKPCADIFCDISRPFLELSVFTESLRNAFYFLSPVSGSATRGTWFHNVSFFQWMTTHDVSKSVMIVLAIALGAISVGTLSLGSFRLWNTHRMNVVLFGGIFLLALFTAFIMHGDSRQRLIVAPFAIPIQLIAIRPYLSKLQSLLQRNSS